MRAQLRNLLNCADCMATVTSILFIGAITVSFLLDLRSRYDTAIENAQQSARSFTEVLSEHTVRTFEAVDRALHQTELIRDSHPVGGADAREALRRLQESSPVIHTLAWTDATGRFVAHSIDDHPRDGLADASHFIVQRDHADSGFYVAPPFRSVRTGEWITAASRRLNNPDGSFAGVVTASLDQSYFSGIYRAIGLKHNAVVYLLHRDGKVLAREPFVEQAIGHSFQTSPLFAEHLPQAPAGIYQFAGSLDGARRIGAYKSVPGLPLVMAVNYERASVLGPWFRHVCVFLPLAVLLVAGILVATGLVRRQTKRLAQKTNMLEAALANISQGICMFDASARITFVTRRYLEMYNLSPEIVKPGCTLRELLDHRSALGSLAPDPAQYCDEILREVGGRKTAARRIIDRDGRVVRAINHPIRGSGWVTTHEDATDQLRAEAELEDTRNFLKTVIDHVPTTIVVKSTSDLRYVLFNVAGQKFFALRPEQIIGKTPHECFPQEMADFIVARDKALIDTGRSRIEDQHSVETPDGVREVTTETLVVRGGDGVPKYLMNVIVDITERKRSEAQIVYIAHHDLLTGLPNRTFFMEKIEDAGARLRRWGEPFTVLLLDLDRFKIVNDSLGHPAGDTLLKETALRLKASLRETDVLARLGGDEFAIIQAGEASPREGAAALAQRVIDVVKPPYIIEGNAVTIGTSIGIAMAPGDDTEPNELIKKADLALYRAKSQGRNGFRFFDIQMTREADARHQLENDLRAAVARSELELHYQPIVDIRTRQPCGVEALARWRHPQRGWVPPDHFIPLAEETGLISTLGEWVLQQACADAAAWPPHIKVAVNLSPLQFRKSDLFDTVLCVLVASGLPPERLELEITESVLLESDTDPLAVIRRLKNIGVSLALDDFGTGYSSLSYLTKFPFDKIKIDKSFTQNVTRRADCAAIISSVRALGSGLNMLTTAEGVETEQQFGILQAAGVDLAQGYLFGRPCAAGALDLTRVGAAKSVVDAA